MHPDFLLTDEVIFLNHGSFGACPRPVFEVYQAWQREAERQPVAFFQRRYDALMDEARGHLAAYVGADVDSLAFVPNATEGLNAVAWSLPWAAGDEILTSEHEYGALELTWQAIGQHYGTRLVRQPVPLPLSSPAAFADALWQGVTPRTRAIFLSHVTSPSALIFPIEEVCRRARQAGLWTIIDGAHALGQMPLDMRALDADFYSGNAHKWLCAPKGAAFLYVRPDWHDLMRPLAISWGCQPNSRFAQRMQWQGTRDIAAYLSVPAAIAYQRDHDWERVRTACHALACQAHARISALTGLPALSPAARDYFVQMVALPLPPCDPAALKARLLDDYRIEIPITHYTTADGQVRQMVRASFQAYNTQADLDALLEALAKLL
jgi:isopenicillin-N epimerase